MYYQNVQNLQRIASEFFPLMCSGKDSILLHKILDKVKSSIWKPSP